MCARDSRVWCRYEGNSTLVAHRLNKLVKEDATECVEAVAPLLLWTDRDFCSQSENITAGCILGIHPAVLNVLESLDL